MTILSLDTEVQNIDSTYSYQINNQTIQLQKIISSLPSGFNL